MRSVIDEIERNGFALLPAVFTDEQAVQIADGLMQAVERCEDPAVALRSRGVVYGARNVLDLYPPAKDLWQVPVLVDLLSAVLGPNFGLVRALYFDKPPARSWSLAWHKDLTIAVTDNSLASQHFCKPTLKAGVPHVEAPAKVLEIMLMLRIHLDDSTAANGPLQVIPGSHRSGKHIDSGSAASPVTIFAHRGDVLAMRPLVTHASGESHAGTALHRRVLHLEFAGSSELADGFAWHTFAVLHAAHVLE
jgi:hypothetical protein